jgi:hypothetical protein
MSEFSHIIVAEISDCSNLPIVFSEPGSHSWPPQRLWVSALYPFQSVPLNLPTALFLASQGPFSLLATVLVLGVRFEFIGTMILADGVTVNILPLSHVCRRCRSTTSSVSRGESQQQGREMNCLIVGESRHMKFKSRIARVKLANLFEIVQGPLDSTRNILKECPIGCRVVGSGGLTPRATGRIIAGSTTSLGG